MKYCLLHSYHISKNKISMCHQVISYFYPCYITNWKVNAKKNGLFKSMFYLRIFDLIINCISLFAKVAFFKARVNL